MAKVDQIPNDSEMNKDIKRDWSVWMRVVFAIPMASPPILSKENPLFLKAFLQATVRKFFSMW